MKPDDASPLSNKLLARLPPETYARLLPHLERIHVERAERVAIAATPLEYVLFPTTAVISMMVDTSSGASAEITLIGNEGMCGMMTLFSGTRPWIHAVTDMPGYAYRINASLLRQYLVTDIALQGLLLRYSVARMLEMAGHVICNTHHSVAQRLCRALLMRAERVGDTISMTQEVMASYLGTRRAGVTRAAIDLRKAGVISYSRSSVTILDRAALEVLACECYANLSGQLADLNLAPPAFAARPR